MTKSSQLAGCASMRQRWEVLMIRRVTAFAVGSLVLPGLIVSAQGVPDRSDQAPPEAGKE